MFRKAGATCRRRADLFCSLAATLLEQERLKAETALALKQEAIEQGYSQF